MQITKKLSTLILLCVGVLSFTTSKAQPQPGKKIEINKASNVYILQPVTEKEARKLGKYLLDIKYFDFSKDKAVQILKEGKVYKINFVVDVDYLQTHPELRQGFQDLTPEISKKVFNGKQVVVQLVDTQLKKV